MMLLNDEIYRILNKAGFDGCRVRPIGAGHYNDSYYIEADNGKFVLRIAPPDSVPKLFYEVDMMKSEVNIHNLVREHTDAPAPEIIYHDFSRDAIDRDYLVMEYLRGSSGPFDERELGGYVRQIHAIESDKFGYPERAAPMGTSWPELFHTYVKLILLDCLSCGVIDNREQEYFLSVYDRQGGVIGDVKP